MNIELSEPEFRFIQDCIEAAINEGLPGLGSSEDQYGHLSTEEQHALFGKLKLQDRTWLYDRKS
jgi:hypothetical protein